MAEKIQICAKYSDWWILDILFHANVEFGDDFFEYSGYVPDFFPGNHYGDDIQLEIDLESGKILNWKHPTKKDIEEMKNG